MAARKKPSTIAQAKAAKSPTFYGKGNKELAAVTKEELKKSGLSLRDYLNKQQGKTRRTAAKVAPRPKPKSRPTGSSAPLGGKADPYKYVGKGPRGQKGQAPVPTTEEKVKMAGLVLGGLGGPAAKVATKVATTYGRPFVNKLANRIKNLSDKQQESIMKEVARSNLSRRDMNIALRNAETPKNIRTEIARQKSAESGKRAPGEKPFRQTIERKGQQARNRKRRRETRRQRELKEMNKAIGKKGGGNLKSVDTQQNPGLAKLPTNVRNRMGYAKSGGKVVNRKGGGMIGSGNDLVASMYD